MNILHVTPYYPPAWAFGPTPAAVAALARAQVGHGHRVTVLTTNAMAPHERLYANDTVVDGVRVVRVPNLSGATRTWLGCSSPLGMRRAARRLAADGVDVVHLHELVALEHVRVVPVIRSEVPVVVSLHGQLMEVGRLPAVTRRAWLALGARVVCRRLDAVVAASTDEAQHARGAAAALCRRLTEAVIIADGVDTYDSGYAPGSGGAPLLIVDGHTAQPDAMRAVLDGVAAIATADPPVRLLVVGESPAVSAGRPYAVSRGLDGRVTFTGYLPPSRMQQALCGATGLLLPEGARATQAVVIDALSRGVVVLTTGGTLAPESRAVIRVTGGGWEDALRRVLDDPDTLREDAVASARPYGWPAVALRWTELYARLAIRPGRAAARRRAEGPTPDRRPDARR